jgi:hypothetical protein
MARTHVEEVSGVVGEMRGTGAELMEVESRAEPRRAVIYGRWRRQWRCARTERATELREEKEMDLALMTAQGR